MMTSNDQDSDSQQNPNEWFTKSLLPPISQDVDMVRSTTEEHAIFHSQHLDLIYS
jgi:hypothetical protein